MSEQAPRMYFPEEIAELNFHESMKAQRAKRDFTFDEWNEFNGERDEFIKLERERLGQGVTDPLEVLHLSPKVDRFVRHEGVLSVAGLEQMLESGYTPMVIGMPGLLEIGTKLKQYRAIRTAAGNPVEPVVE